MFFVFRRKIANSNELLKFHFNQITKKGKNVKKKKKKQACLPLKQHFLARTA